MKSFQPVVDETSIAICPSTAVVGQDCAQYWGLPCQPYERLLLRRASDDKVRRFEKAVRDLIDEDCAFVDHQGWLDAAAARAGVDLQEVLPTRH